MKTKMDFRYHADICFVCFKLSHLNGSVFCLYKKEIRRLIVQLACYNWAKLEDLLPSQMDFYLGNQADPGEWGLLTKRVSGATSFALFVVCVLIHVHIRIEERVSGEIRVWGPGKTVLRPLVFKGLCP